MLFDCHIHTPLCGHAVGKPNEYVWSAARKGIDLITFTCHIAMAEEGFGQRGKRMTFANLTRYREFVRQASTLGDHLGVRVLFGIEAEIFPCEKILRGMDDILNNYHFDFVLGALHHQLPAFREWLKNKGIKSDRDIIDTYFTTLTVAVASGRYHSIAHLDLIQIYNTVPPFDPTKYERTIRKFLCAASENGVCLEINTSGWAKDVKEMHPAPIILQWAHEESNELTLGSDAHRPELVGRFFPKALNTARGLGFEHICYFYAGRKIQIPISQMVFNVK